MSEFAQSMRERREHFGLSKSRFAAESGLHVSTVSQIENGRLNPYPGQIEKIEATFKRLEATEVA